MVTRIGSVSPQTLGAEELLKKINQVDKARNFIQGGIKNIGDLVKYISKGKGALLPILRGRITPNVGKAIADYHLGVGTELAKGATRFNIENGRNLDAASGYGLRPQFGLIEVVQRQGPDRLVDTYLFSQSDGSLFPDRRHAINFARENNLTTKALNEKF